MYDTLTFKNMAVEMLLKITYLIGAIYITLFSLGLIAVNILACLGLLIFGNLILRVSYELILISIITCRNTTEINKKMKVSEVKAEEERPE